MQADTAMLPNPAAAAESKNHEGGLNLEDEKSSTGVVIDHGSGANRWPRQETLALLKIRSDMDALFRDSSLKAPLWEEVSRKLSELGYNRSAKKCKEKFENVYKYHKRTKDTKTGKSEGKTYKFFDQLQALESHPISQPPPPSPPIPPPPPADATPSRPPETRQENSQTPITTSATTLPWTNPPNVSHASISSKNTNPIDVMPLNIFTPPNSIIQSYPYQNNFKSFNATINPTSNSTNSSSDTASAEELEGSKKRKRKWKDMIEKVTKDLVKKQEEMQRKFLETIDKQEQERILRLEAWRMQEISRLNKEHEMLIQERSATIAKDAAILSFLQKLSGNQTPSLNPRPQPLETQPMQVPPAPASTPPAAIPKSEAPARKEINGDNANNNNTSSSSRWPKPEIEALIKLRTHLDIKYKDIGPKGPLWEEISIEMQKLGYNRSAKRCKEKWENINKYFKKVKDNNKKIRSQDSKTCPYFNQLDALYKSKMDGNDNPIKNANTIEPLKVGHQEQQWPPQQERLKQQEMMIKTMEDIHRDLDDGGGEEEEYDYSEDEEEDGDRYEMVTNKQGQLI